MATLKVTVYSIVYKIQIAQSTYEEKGQLSALFLSTINDAPLAQMSHLVPMVVLILLVRVQHSPRYQMAIG